MKSYLEKNYRRKETGKAPYYVDSISESVTPYQVKKQGEYTLGDYDALPDERRVELIDGVIYDMSALTSTHQLIALELGSLFRTYIKEKKGSCLPLVFPVDV